jgi:probable rRNA maturation factor
VNALAVAVAREGVRSAVSEARLADAARLTLRAENVTHALISITLVTAQRIAALNAKHLRHRGPTDVISFGFSRERAGPLVADIYIAPGVWASESARSSCDSWCTGRCMRSATIIRTGTRG